VSDVGRNNLLAMGSVGFFITDTNQDLRTYVLPPRATGDEHDIAADLKSVAVAWVQASLPECGLSSKIVQPLSHGNGYWLLACKLVIRT
jgi:hypothetical protein